MWHIISDCKQLEDTDQGDAQWKKRSDGCDENPPIHRS